MALSIPAGFAQIAFRFEFLEGGEPAITTIGHDFNGQVGTNAATATAIADAWQTIVVPSMSNVIRYLGVSARIGVAGSEPIVIDINRSVNGNNPQAAVPRNTAMLVRKRTGRGGRRGRGRMFVPGIVFETDVDQAGLYTSSVLVGWQNLFNSLYDQLVTIAGGPVLLHDDQVITSYSSVTGKPVYGPFDPGPPNDITSLTVDSRVATQRRRLRD
jgi:hypothetical protein